MNINEIGAGLAILGWFASCIGIIIAIYIIITESWKQKKKQK
jgi:hypothetical protein